ncbi:MAG: NUDIX hydrolase [Acidobacteria bacterium]|nr:MAG: NUDIX hydrolase [Acidobacteriota bacterium]RPJ74224.1 MAG: NUDIX hydrolase [Acidobacteriota bacterium]
MDEARGTLLKSDVVYEGRVLSVHRDEVRLPKGNVARLEVVRHRGSAVLLPMPDLDHVVLVRQYRYAVDRWMWELAAGSLEPGEEPAVGAARECEEETGLVPSRVEALGSFYPTPGYCDEKMHFFRLTGLRERGEGEERAMPDADEDIRVRSFSLQDVRDMVRRGEIEDLKTAAGIALL